MKLSEAVQFNDRGLVPAVIQDARDGTVLMVAYMNKRSLLETLRRKESVFWSRSRQALWRKGESSGNVQKIKEIRIDCDGDCLLIKVEQVGRAACHTGHRSCFFRKANPTGSLRVIGQPLFNPKRVYGK